MPGAQLAVQREQLMLAKGQVQATLPPLSTTRPIGILFEAVTEFVLFVPAAAAPACLELEPFLWGWLGFPGFPLGHQPAWVEGPISIFMAFPMVIFDYFSSFLHFLEKFQNPRPGNIHNCLFYSFQKGGEDFRFRSKPSNTGLLRLFSWEIGKI